MTILEVIISLASGGAERFVTDLCNELSLSKNDEIELLVLKDDKLPEYSFYTVAQLAQKEIHEKFSMQTMVNNLDKIYIP